MQVSNVFLDTNVLMDVLLERKPFVADAQHIWFLSERGAIRGWISILSFPNIYYIVRKTSGQPKAEQMLRMLRDSFTPVALDEQILHQAMDAKFRDFEDAIQYFSALRVNADCLLTRNPDHFRNPVLPVFSPAQFLATHSPQ